MSLSNYKINVENISKRYRLGVYEKEDTFFEYLKNLFLYPIKNFSKISSLQKFSDEDNSVFWALKNISFQLKEGEKLGFIGHNGAGKSTLLKILSRVTDPTEGQVKIRGKVASLLEVGTGFHPELSGRDNIFMNGTILGMKKSEIEKKFNDIVSFSGVKQHIDTPIKFYSSGMKVRLAFSVAAHLEPEILIIDEVLAVGDADFQAKCLGRMNEIANEGRTIIFVSHDLVAIQNLCDRVCVLDQGKLCFVGSPLKAIEFYLSLKKIQSSKSIGDILDRKGGDNFRFEDLQLFNSSKVKTQSVISGEDIFFNISYSAKKINELKNISIDLTIRTFDEKFMFTCSTNQSNFYPNIKKKGNFNVVINKLPISSGKYEVTLFAKSDGIILDWVKNVFSFSVIDGDFYGTGKLNTHKYGFFVNNVWNEK